MNTRSGEITAVGEYLRLVGPSGYQVTLTFGGWRGSGQIARVATFQTLRGAERVLNRWLRFND